MNLTELRQKTSKQTATHIEFVNFITNFHLYCLCFDKIDKLKTRCGVKTTFEMNLTELRQKMSK